MRGMTLPKETMTNSRKPDNPNKPGIVVYIDGELHEVKLRPEVDPNKIAAEIDAVLNPKPKERKL